MKEKMKEKHLSKKNLKTNVSDVNIYRGDLTDEQIYNHRRTYVKDLAK